MSTEQSRESQVLKIHKKDDKETFVRIKIISLITFVDPDDQYQETIYKFDNSHNSSREVSVVDVDGLPVERIIKFNMKDAISGGQEFIYSLLTDPKVHKTTHTTKIYRYDNGVKDESTWIKVDRIDELQVMDSADQFQETIFKLKWPDLEIDEWDGSSAGGEICDFPIRIDPFQNIIAAQFSNYYALLTICNINSITDDNFNLSINNKRIMPIDFSANDEKTAYAVIVGKVEQYVPIDPTFVVRNKIKYHTFEKSPFRKGLNLLQLEFVADNGFDNYFVIKITVLRSTGETVVDETYAISGRSGESFSQSIDLSSLKVAK